METPCNSFHNGATIDFSSLRPVHQKSSCKSLAILTFCTNASIKCKCIFNVVQANFLQPQGGQTLVEAKGNVVKEV